MYLILLGTPGTGKGTQAKLVAERLGIAHVATGDMFRHAVEHNTPLGMQAKTYLDQGELVPDELTIGMLKERMQETDAGKGAVLDGFPRTLEQARALDSMLDGLSQNVDFAVNLLVSDDELVRRLSGRWLCPSCGEIYQEASRPPSKAGACDNCGARLVQRTDDRPEVVRSRLRVQRPPAELLAHYAKRGKLREVNGEQPADDVTREILQAIGTNGDVGAAAR
jgi:adenylate kinase